MAAQVAVAAVKTVGVKNIGKAFLGIVFVVIAGLILAIGLPLAVVAATLATAGPDDGGWPVVDGWTKPIATYVITSGFGLRPSSCSVCSYDHAGVDMAGPFGAAIFAAGPGKVIHAGNLGGYGNAVMVDHGGGLVSVYGHMAYGSLRVQVGDAVKGGTRIGQQGSTGASSGAHLHFELRRHGAAFDPMPFMARIGLPL